MDYAIVNYSPAIKHQTADLRSRVLGDSIDVNIAYLEWKYEQNPYIDSPILHVALADGRVVGMRGMYGSQWQFGDGISRVIPATADFAIAQDHRGRWLDRRLVAAAQVELANRGFDYVFSLSAGAVTRFLRIQAGCKRAATYQYFRRGDFPALAISGRRATRPRPNLLRRGLNLIRRKLNNWNAVVPFKQFDEWGKNLDGPIIASATPRILQMSDLVAQCVDPTRFHHVRDERYYAWRLRDPHSRYRFIFCQKSMAMEGFFILQQKISGGAVTVVDWAATTSEVWSGLLQAVVDSGTDQLQIASTTFSERQQKTLRQSGFDKFVEPDTQKHPASGILVEALSDLNRGQWSIGGQQLIDKSRWDMRMIYSDTF